MNDYSEAIEALNDLIQINHDRVEGYQTAIEEMRKSNNTMTAALFEQYVKDSKNNISELSQYVSSMGGSPDHSTTIGGKIHRMWMDIKNTFSVHEKESALESCNFGDEAAIKAYESALADTSNNFSSDITSTLNGQLATIKATHFANVAYEKSVEAINS